MGKQLKRRLKRAFPRPYRHITGFFGPRKQELKRVAERIASKVKKYINANEDRPEHAVEVKALDLMLEEVNTYASFAARC